MSLFFLQVTDDDLRNFFADVGGVVAVRILKDKFTKKSRVSSRDNLLTLGFKVYLGSNWVKDDVYKYPCDIPTVDLHSICWRFMTFFHTGSRYAC